MPFISHIPERKAALGLTNHELARRAGLSPATVSFLTSGRLTGSVTLATLGALTRALECDFRDLLEWVPEDAVPSWQAEVLAEQVAPNLRSERIARGRALREDAADKYVDQFVLEGLVQGEGLRARKEEVYAAYRAWLKGRGVTNEQLIRNRRQFGKYLEECHGIWSKRNNQGQWEWVGLCVRQEEQS